MTSGLVLTAGHVALSSCYYRAAIVVGAVPGRGENQLWVVFYLVFSFLSLLHSTSSISSAPQNRC